MWRMRTTKQLIAALEEESIKYETYFKLIIATGMRRGECCGLKWKDVDFSEKSIHICRNVVKVTGEDCPLPAKIDRKKVKKTE